MRTIQSIYTITIIILLTSLNLSTDLPSIQTTDFPPSLEFSFQFSNPTILNDVTNSSCFITLENCSQLINPGKPLIPFKTIFILLPPNTSIKSYFTESKPTFMNLTLPLRKTQYATSISSYDCTKNSENIHTYQGLERTYPPNQAIQSEIGYKKGYAIVSFQLYPIQYNPINKQIYYTPTLTLHLNLTYTTQQQHRTLYKSSTDDITSLVINPNTISKYPITQIHEKNQEKHYVIITTDDLKNQFIPLLEHKKQYLPGTIVTLDEIIEDHKFWVNGSYGDATNASNGNPWVQNGDEIKQNYNQFNDTSAHIRNFIRYAHDHWNTQYILLGGDVELIPTKTFHCSIANWSSGKIIKPIEGQIVSDYYFAALDGTWNADEDIYYGESSEQSIKDEADYFSEIYVGRAPVNDGNEVNIFVNKVISYETSEKPTSIALHQSYINTQKKPDTVIVPENCARWIPEQYNIHRIYEANHTITLDQWLSLFKSSEHMLIYHVGNGYDNGISPWYQLSWDQHLRVKFDILNAGSMSNTFYPIHLSISCLSGNFSDNECLMEELLLSTNGGPSACIANSEVGCIAMDDASAYSSEYFEQIFKEMFIKGETNLGEINQHAKEHFSMLASTQQQYRWCFFEINLLGDPETPLFTTRNKMDFAYDTFTVDGDYKNITPKNNTCFSSIQQAIDAIGEYGTILIHEGIYQEYLHINKTITIKGLKKENTILQTNTSLQQPLITLKCHSTTITNMTIQSTSNQSEKDIPLIHILPTCNGNTISENIIQGSNSYGILVEDSIRNAIEKNTITQNHIGIAILTVIEELLPTKVIVTCDNHISKNRITQNHECGVYIQGSIHNYITNNTFINNGNKNQSSFGQHQALCLKRTRWNHIDGNYWDTSQQAPYPIKSLNGPLLIFRFDFSRGLMFQLYKCILIINIGIPHLVYDDNPAQTPFCE